MMDDNDSSVRVAVRWTISNSSPQVSFSMAQIQFNFTAISNNWTRSLLLDSSHSHSNSYSGNKQWLTGELQMNLVNQTRFGPVEFNSIWLHHIKRSETASSQIQTRISIEPSQIRCNCNPFRFKSNLNLVIKRTWRRYWISAPSVNGWAIELIGFHLSVKRILGSNDVELIELINGANYEASLIECDADD